MISTYRSRSASLARKSLMAGSLGRPAADDGPSDSSARVSAASSPASPARAASPTSRSSSVSGSMPGTSTGVRSAQSPTRRTPRSTRPARWASASSVTHGQRAEPDGRLVRTCARPAPAWSAAACAARWPRGNGRPSASSSSLSRRIADAEAAPSDSLGSGAEVRPSSSGPDDPGEPAPQQLGRGARGRHRDDGDALRAEDRRPRAGHPDQVLLDPERAPGLGRRGTGAGARPVGAGADDVVVPAPRPAVLHGLLPHRGDRAG